MHTAATINISIYLLHLRRGFDKLGAVARDRTNRSNQRDLPLHRYPSGQKHMIAYIVIPKVHSTQCGVIRCTDTNSHRANGAQPKDDLSLDRHVEETLEHRDKLCRDIVISVFLCPFVSNPKKKGRKREKKRERQQKGHQNGPV